MYNHIKRGELNMYDTLIIGAGQAGISIGYHLNKLNRNVVILERRSEIG